MALRIATRFDDLPNDCGILLCLRWSCVLRHHTGLVGVLRRLGRVLLVLRLLQRSRARVRIRLATVALAAGTCQTRARLRGPLRGRGSGGRRLAVPRSALLLTGRRPLHRWLVVRLSGLRLLVLRLLCELHRLRCLDLLRHCVLLRLALLHRLAWLRLLSRERLLLAALRRVLLTGLGRLRQLLARLIRLCRLGAGLGRLLTCLGRLLSGLGLLRRLLAELRWLRRLRRRGLLVGLRRLLTLLR